MHIHTSQASGVAHSLAGAQATESTAALKRARELRETAAKLKATAQAPASDLSADPEIVAMIGSWSGQSAGQSAGQNGGQAAGQAFNQGADAGFSAERALDSVGAVAQIRPVQSVPRTTISGQDPNPVSFWA